VSTQPAVFENAAIVKRSNMLKRLRKFFFGNRESAEKSHPLHSEESVTTASPENEAYDSDAPISDPAHDDFDRWPFARRIAETIVARTDNASLCIGIYGSWGEGKTTVLQFIERQLAVHKKVRLIHFNPWRFRTLDDLFAGFFNTLASGIGASLKTRPERAAKAVGPYAKMLGPVSVGVAGFVNVSASEIAKSLADAATTDVETLKARLDRLIKETDQKLVIIVDDIDRMDHAEIHAVFQLIKACGDFLRTIYVLAFDDRAVAAALGSKYGEGNVKAGYDFLEKIVQVPLRLPAASGNALRRFFLREVDRVLSKAQIELSEGQVHSFVDGFDRGFGRAVTTPRMAKRYANALAFGIPLLAGEVSIVDLLLIEAMRVFYPSLYDFVKMHSETVLTPPEDYDKQERIALLSSGIDTIDIRHRTDARRLLSVLFPPVDSIFGNTAYGFESEAAWTKEKRVCSTEYFQRYFSYALAKGDISDHKIAALLTAAEQNNAKLVSKQFEELLSTETAESVLSKLSHRTDELSAPGAALLAKEFSRYGTLFLRIGGFARLSPFTRAGGVVAALVERSPKGVERVAAAIAVLEQAQPIGFAAECLSWFRTGRDRPESDRMFTESDADELSKTLALRINAIADCAMIKNQGNLLLLLYVWSKFGDPDAPGNLLARCLQSDPALVLPFLRSAVGMSYPMDGSPHPGDFERDAYSSVLKYADAAIIYGALEEIFGDRLNRSLGEISRREVQDDERIALQFAALYKKPKPPVTDPQS
jgi:predicted KAP-like P-loop ATPase